VTTGVTATGKSCMSFSRRWTLLTVGLTALTLRLSRRGERGSLRATVIPDLTDGLNRPGSAIRTGWAEMARVDW
jgi:hypothetical protein